MNYQYYYALFSLTFNNVGYKYCGILKCPSKSLIASGRIRKYRERKPYATSVHITGLNVLRVAMCPLKLSPYMDNSVTCRLLCLIR